MYDIGDYVVYPGHGVGQIVAKSQREIAGTTLNTVSVKIISNGMKMIVPEGSEEIRPLVSDKEINEVYELLSDHNVKIKKETWNRRHREYMSKINTGSILEVADVLRSLLILKFTKKLSYGEKRVVEQCKDLIVKEISITSGENEDSIEQRIDSIFVGMQA